MHARIGWQNLRTSEFLENGDYMLITGTDFVDGSINYSTCYFVNKERYEQDILITKDGTLGKVALVQGLSMPATLNAGIFNIEIKNELEIDNKYLFQYLKAPFLLDYVKKRATGGTIKHLNQNILVNFPVLTPQKLEQTKIGQYFSNLDNLITLHQRKILLDKYFLTIDWEQRKLGDCTFLSGKKNKNNLNLEPYAITNEHGFIPQNKAHDEFGYMKDTDRRAYNIVSKNSFAYNPARINIGSIGYYKGTENVIISSLYEVFQTVDSVYDPFLWQWFKTKDFQNWIIRLQDGSVRLYFYYDKLCECIIRMPKLEEQIKIANYFEALDNLITLHQWKCMISRKNIVYAWEQRKLGKIFVSMQNNTLSRADLSYDSGVAMNVHYGDILVKFGEVLDIKSERLPMIVDETVLDKYKSSFLKNGDIIIADTAEDETVGKCTEIAGLSDEYVISGLHTIPYRPLQKFAFGYLGYYMNSTSYHNQLLPLMQGIKVTSISKVSLQNTVIIYPKSKVEQAAIGKYFYNLDNLITLHQWECIVCTKIKVNTSIQCKFIKIGVKLQKCILLSIILLFKRRKISCIFYVNILLRFIKVIELEIELIFGIIDGTIIVIFYLKIRCLYLNIFCTFIFKFNK